MLTKANSFIDSTANRKLLSTTLNKSRLDLKEAKALLVLLNRHCMMQHEKKIYEKEEIKINGMNVKIIKQNKNKKVK